MDIWWRRLPRFASRRSRVLSSAFADGGYLVAWPAVAAYGPLLALVLGAVLSYFRGPYEETFTFSMFGMALMFIISSFGAALGVYLTIGYGGADFLHYVYSHAFQGSAVDIVLQAGSLLLSYLLLAMLLVFVPLVSQGLCRDTLRPVDRFLKGKSFRVPALLAFEFIVFASVQAGLVYAWIQNVPTLIRPVYTWRGLQPPSEAMSPLQKSGWILVMLAVIFAFLRVVFEFQANADAIRNGLALGTGAQRAGLSTPRSSSRTWEIIWRATFATILLAGLLSSWWEAPLVAVAIAGTLLVRDKITRRQNMWTRLVLHVPLVARLAFASFVSFLLARQIIQLMWLQTSTFLPVTISALLSMLVFAFLVPQSKVQMDAQRGPKQVSR